MLSSTFEQGFISATESAALAAAQTMGYGQAERSAQVARMAMHAALERLEIGGRVRIGVGERDAQPLLWNGEPVGALLRDGTPPGADPRFDLAVDPLEGSRLCASGGSGAISVLVATERGGLFPAPDVYMEKLVVGPSAAGVIHLDAPVPENLRNIARAFHREVSDLTVMVLERERNAQIITDVRYAGARIRLIQDGDLSAGIAAAVRGTGIHALMGVGGAPEGILTAAAMRCLGGEIQARFRPVDENDRERLRAVGLDDPERVLSTADLVPGEEVMFSATGVTAGELLRGVRFFGGGSRTSTLWMSLPDRTIRFVETIQRDDLKSPVLFH